MTLAIKEGITNPAYLVIGENEKDKTVYIKVKYGDAEDYDPVELQDAPASWRIMYYLTQGLLIPLVQANSLDDLEGTLSGGKASNTIQ